METYLYVGDVETFHGGLYMKTLTNYKTAIYLHSKNYYYLCLKMMLATRALPSVKYCHLCSIRALPSYSYS